MEEITMKPMSAKRNAPQFLPRRLFARMQLLMIATVLAAMFASSLPAEAQSDGGAFASSLTFTNGEAGFQLIGPAGQYYRIQTSTNLMDWEAWATLRSVGTNNQTDSAAPYLTRRFFRAEWLSDTNVVPGDHFATANGDMVIQPLAHATFLVTWNGKVIYNDPDAPADRPNLYNGQPAADLVLIGHDHGDHFDTTALNRIAGSNTVIIAPQAVFNAMPAALRRLTTVLTNGAATNVHGIDVAAVPAYNSNHPRGAGNGYVLMLGGKRVYMSGDTGNTPEMRDLQNIDIAFVCMNIPFTMDTTNAATAVRAFRPKVVYPYHYRNQNGTLADLNAFKRLVGTNDGVEVRLRKWY